jgi:hypothetical protein
MISFARRTSAIKVMAGNAVTIRRDNMIMRPT